MAVLDLNDPLIQQKIQEALANQGVTPTAGENPWAGSILAPAWPKVSEHIAGLNKAKAAGMKRGGSVKKMARGGVTRGDGCASRGKTKGRVI